MSDIKSDFYSDTTKRLGRMLVDGLKSKGILTEFVLVSGVKGSRKVTPIAEAFENLFSLNSLVKKLSIILKNY